MARRTITRRSLRSSSPKKSNKPSFCELMEKRYLMCAPSAMENLIAPPVWDPAIEQQYQRTPQPGEHQQQAVSIVWSNRGQATDNFTSTFGTSAPAARAVVDAALANWSRVITSFNRADGTTTLQINISISGLNVFGGAGAPAATAPADGKPRTGSITLTPGNGSADPNDSNGWYFDPTPTDNAEYNGTILNAFGGRAPGSLNSDFYSVVVAEVTHVLGLISDKSNNGGSWNGYLLESSGFLTNTGVMDSAEGSGTQGRLWTFDGPSVDHLMTSYNSGDATNASWGNIVHTAGGTGSFTFPGGPTGTWIASEDAGNALYGANERTDPSWVDAHILADAYGYSIIDPTTFGSFYALLNRSTGVLTVRGGALTSSDVIYLSNNFSAGTITVSVDVGTDVAGTGPFRDGTNMGAWISTFNSSDITSINIDGGDGTDYIRIEGTGSKPVSVNGGAGDDFVDFSINAKNLDNISSSVNVNGGAGFDQVFTYDNNSTLAKAFTITSGRFDRPGWGGFFYASDLEALNLTTGTAADFVTVQSTFANQPIWLFSAGGNDDVTIGNRNGNGLQSIAADITVQNSPAFTKLTISDFGNTNARNWNMDFSGASDWGKINNLAPARIYWKAVDIGSLLVETGSAADTGLVYSSNVNLTLDSSGGTDNVQIGDAAVGGAQAILKPITVTNHANFTVLTISDAGDASARTPTLDSFDANIDRISNLAPAAIMWRINDAFAMQMITGNAADTVNVIANRKGIDLDSSGGNDTVNIGSATVNGAQNVTGDIDVRNRHGLSTINVTDANDGGAHNASISYSGFGVLQGLMPGILNWQSAETALLSITTGNGTDSISVASMAAPLALNSTGGSDIVNLGNTTNGLAGIVNNISIANAPAFTTLNITDTANTAGRNWTFNSDGISESIGISPTATISYKLGDTLPGTINMSNGVDNVAIRGVDTRALTINGNNGNDVFTIGSAANTVDPINIALSIDCGLGSDSIILNNAGDTTEGGFTVNVSQVTESDMAAVNFAQTELLELRGGTGAAPIHTFTTIPSGVFTTMVPGASHDVIKVTNNSNPLTIRASGGLDDVSVNDGSSGSGARVVFDQTTKLGALTIKSLGTASATGTNTLLTAATLSIATNAKLDLFANDFLATATAKSTIEGYIRSAYNFGGWNGAAGIFSTTAKNNPTGNTALGLLSGTDFNNNNGGTFNGQTVNNSDVLVKYTYYGDVDFNGMIDVSDYNLIDFGFGNHLGGWANGDVDYSGGATDVSDYNLVDFAFATHGGAL